MANPPKVDLSDLTSGKAAPKVDLSDLAGGPKQSSYDRALSDARRGEQGSEVSGTIAHGMSLGFSDDLMALGAAGVTGAKNLVHDLRGESKPYSASEASQAMRQAEREGRERFAKKMPVTHGVTDIGSMLFGPGEVAALEKVGLPLARSVLGGGILGGVAGIGNAQGSPIDRFLAAGPGALMGAGTGGVVHGALNAPGIFKGTASALEEAMSRVKDQMESEPGRITPAQHAAGVKAGRRIVSDMVGDKMVALEGNRAEKIGKPVTAAEAIGRAGRKQMGVLTRRTGTTGDVVDPILAQRSRQAAKRVVDDLRDVTGIDGNVTRDQMEATADALRAKARPLYDQWHLYENVDSPELQRFLATPEGEAALTNAHRIARNEHENAYELGLADEPEEPRIPRGMVEFVHRGQRILAKKGREATQVAQQLGRDPSAPDADGDALWEARDEIMERLANGPRPKIVTAKGWDFIKRGLDQELNKYRDPVTKKLDESQVGVRQIRKLRGELGDALTDPETPWGKAAAAAYKAGGDPIRMEEAFEDAEKMISGTTRMHQFKERWNGLDEPDKQAMRAGVGAALRDAAGRGKMRFKELLTPDAEEKFQIMFGEDAGLELADRMRIEADMIEHGYKMHSKGGSDTFQNVDTAQEQAERIKNTEAGLRSTRSALKGDFLGAAAHILRAPFVGAIRASQTPIDEAARNEMGRLLAMSPSELAKILREEGAKPDEVSQVVRWIERIGKAAPKVATRAGTVAGARVGRGDSEDPDNLPPDATQ